MTKKLLILLLTALSFTGYVAAQPPNLYVLEKKTGTYAELTNDTTVPGAFSSSSGVWMFDLIGEKFTFFDKTYNIDNVKKHIVFSNNGFVRVEDDSTFIVIDAAFTIADSIDVNSKVSYTVEGTPGHKIIKVQWKNLKLSTGQAGNYVNYQIWVYQKTGTFEIYYGPSSANNSSGYTNANGPNIGLFHSLQTFTKMFEKIWLNGAPGSYTIDSARNSVFNAVSGMPANGTIFRFVPKKVAANIPGNKTGANVEIYPNPANTHINIQLEEVLTGEANIILYDLQGRLVREYTINEGAQLINLPVDNITDGFYELNLKTKQSTISRKIEIRHR